MWALTAQTLSRGCGLDTPTSGGDPAGISPGTCHISNCTRFLRGRLLESCLPVNQNQCSESRLVSEICLLVSCC